MRTAFALMLVVLAPLAGPPPALAHPGAVDANGCHHHRKTGVFHCHRQPAAEPSNGMVRKTESGLCLAPTERGYAKAKKFEEYATLEACLDSGGSLPD